MSLNPGSRHRRRCGRLGPLYRAPSAEVAAFALAYRSKRAKIVRAECGDDAQVSAPRISLFVQRSSSEDEKKERPMNVSSQATLSHRR